MPLTPDELEPVLTRLEKQAEDLGSKNDQIERLNRAIHDLNDRLQVAESKNQLYEQDLATATAEVTQAIRNERMATERAEALADENREYRRAHERLESENASLRLALHAVQVDAKADAKADARQQLPEVAS